MRRASCATPAGTRHARDAWAARAHALQSYAHALYARVPLGWVKVRSEKERTPVEGKCVLKSHWLKHRRQWGVIMIMMEMLGNISPRWDSSGTTIVCSPI